MRKLFIHFLAATAILLSCQKKVYQTIPYEKSKELNIRLPFVKNYEGKKKAIFVYGSYHTNDSSDAQVADIEAQLNQFRPDIILYEGDYIGVEPTRNKSVHTYFEMGLVRWWAQKNGVEEINLEPPTKEKYQFLRKKYSTDQILLATVLGQNILFIKQHNKADFEKLYATLATEYEKEGMILTGQQKTVAYFYKVYEAFYKIPFDPLTFDYETVEPKFNKTLLNKINQESAAFRDQFMLRKIESSLKMNQKIYVQVGGRHAIVWQPALNRMIEKY